MPTNCNFGIAADILKDCAAPPTAGVEAIAYAFNRSDIDGVKYDETNPRVVSAIKLAPGKGVQNRKFQEGDRRRVRPCD